MHMCKAFRRRPCAVLPKKWFHSTEAWQGERADWKHRWRAVLGCGDWAKSYTNLLEIIAANQHSANQQREGRLDISIRGFWQRVQRAFTDIRIFNPFAPTHLNQKLENCFSNNEREKKRSYGQQVIDVEHRLRLSSFLHMVAMEERPIDSYQI